MKVRSVLVAATTTVAAVALVGGAGAIRPASGDTAPASDPATVSVDPLPTVQITGIVWAQELVGSTVYATGSFTRARPAGAPEGEDEVVRQNLLAFDIETGLLLPFDHRLNGVGRALSVSPDQKRLYVGGDFTRVDGEPHQRIAAFNLQRGTLISGFKGHLSDRVTSLAASDAGVFAGGAFRRSGTRERLGLAGFDRAGKLSRWAPSANNSVRAMMLSPKGDRVFVGGNFSRINGARFYGFASLSPTTGRPDLNWASHRADYPLRNSGSNAGITSFSTDGSMLYLTGYRQGRRPVPPGQFEGRAAVRVGTGELVWISDCLGDSYDTQPIGPVLYSVGHAHNCVPAGYFTELDQRPRRALAETTYPTHQNGPPVPGYASFEGRPAPDQLVWYPSFTAGTFSGASQAAWSIVGNERFLALGGEFPRANGVEQQGLVRFAVSALAPNKVGPEGYVGDGLSASEADGDGSVLVSWAETYDKDNARLEYDLFRRQGSSNIPVCSFDAVESRFWLLDPMSCTDTGQTPGTTPDYRLVVTDPFGNVTTTTTP